MGRSTLRGLTKCAAQAFVIAVLATGCGEDFELKKPKLGEASRLDGRIHLDGIYVADTPEIIVGKEFRHCLRFYPDGRVIKACDTASPEQMKSWFDRKDNKFPSGQVATNGDSVLFRTESPEGPVDFRLEIDGETLHGTATSQTTGNKAQRTYEFVQWNVKGNK